MDAPNVLNKLSDRTGRVVYEVIAYRALTRQELLQQVALYRQQAANPKPGTTVRILTVIGLAG